MDDLLKQRIEVSQRIASDPRFGVGSGYVTFVMVERPFIDEHDKLFLVMVAETHSQEVKDADFVELQGTGSQHRYKDSLQKMSDSYILNELYSSRHYFDAPLPPIKTLVFGLAGYRGMVAGDLTAPPSILKILYTDNPSVLDDVCKVSPIEVTDVKSMASVGFALMDDNLTRKEDRLSEPYVYAVKRLGLLTVASTPEDSYNKQIEVVEAAEAYLKSRNVTVFDFGGATAATPTAIAELRQRLSIHAGTPLIVASSHLPPDMPLDNLPEAVFVTASDTALTHRTVESNIAAAPDDARVVFDRENGLFATGETVVKANRALDIAQRGANIIAAANQMGVYTAPDVRGWGETLPKAEETRRQFDGEVVLITGAASGIGKATAEVFMARGAAVVSIDIDEAIIGMFDSPAFVGVHGDVRNVDDVKRAVEACVKTYGGMDMVFLNAGINEDHAPLEDANMELWQRVMTTNVDGNVVVLKAVYELLKRAPEGGRIIMNASKSAPAPGPGSSSYTVSKAAITQLGRLTALEWGKDNIRVYVVHPNAVFDTKIWKDNMAEKRAKHYGLTLQQYKTNNLLKVEIMARDVGELVADLCGDHFRKVTGIQLPIDGGNNRVI